MVYIGSAVSDLIFHTRSFQESSELRPPEFQKHGNLKNRFLAKTGFQNAPKKGSGQSSSTAYILCAPSQTPLDHESSEKKNIRCNKMKFVFLISILISILVTPTSCFGGYSQEELDLFDLYDELRHTTFYKFLSDPSKNIDLNPKSNKKEIKSAYKKKALKWHPDKWKPENEEDAKIDTKEKVDKRFRQLSAIKEILLDEENLKKTYDNVLKNGLPPGRSFRYVRAVMKMSVKQVLIFVFIIVWGVHYLCLWGRWLEKKWAISDLQSRKVSKKKARELESLVIEKPGFKDTLPFLIWQLLVFCVTVLPGQIKEARQEAENARLLAAEQKKQQEEDQEEYEKQKIEKRTEKKMNRE